MAFPILSLKAHSELSYAQISKYINKTIELELVGNMEKISREVISFCPLASRKEATVAEYIYTHARLNEVTLGNLGKMSPGTTYAQFMAQAQEVARQAGINNPRLMLAMKYKADMNTAQLQIVGSGEPQDVSFDRGATEAVYPIADVEWDAFVADTPVYLVEEPDVHVVDGDKFTAPI